MKNKFLFIVDDFYPAGAQREMYELDLAFKEKGIDIEIMSCNSLNQHKDFPDYFFSMHNNLGTPIKFLDEFIIKNKLLKKIAYRLYFVNVLIKAYSSFRLNSHLRKFKKVFFMGEYVFQHIKNNTLNLDLDIVNIFIMCSRFQGDQYRRMKPDAQYVFISGFTTKKEIEYEFEGFNNFEHINFPLFLNTNSLFKKWNFNSKSPTKKIGVFTRLSKNKPLDPFFYAYKLIIEKGMNVELHIFGAGDSKDAGHERCLRNLGIIELVKFRGHQEDIKQTIINEKLDLIWFQGYLNRPAGYAGFDACLTGTPQLFWDFYEGENLTINSREVIYPHFKNLNMFVDASISVLSTAEYANDLSEKQYMQVMENHNMSRGFDLISHLFN